MHNIISINPSIKLPFYQAHCHVQLEITLRHKPNVLHQGLMYPGKHYRGFTESFNDKISNIIVQNIITAYNCQDEIPLDDRYGNHHT